MKYVIALMVLIIAFACGGNKQKHTGKSYLGLYIDKERPRQGFQYTDAAGNEYNCRYITTTITNDSIVPVSIQFSLDNEYAHPCALDSVKLKTLLLEGKQSPAGISNLLKNMKAKGRQSFTKVLQPKEKWIVTFVTVIGIKYPDLFQMALLSKGHAFRFNVHDSIIKQQVTANPRSLSLGLNFYNPYNLDCHLVIPCGTVSFPGN